MRNKYHTSAVCVRTYDGIKFDSKAEMNRYIELKRLKKAGLITNLVLQPRFKLLPSFRSSFQKTMIRGVTYVADFQYEENGKTVVEDVKGARTKDYIIKMKFFLYQNPDIIFREIR